MKRKTQQTGFTLIELMITVGIITILAAVAWPAYERQMTKNRRSDGIAALLKASKELQQCYSDVGGYIDKNGTNCTHLSESAKKYYNITSVLTTDTFTLTATPKGAQADDTECTTLTLDHLGQKGFTTSGNGTLNRCWSN